MKAAFISDLHIGPAGFHNGIQRKLTQYSKTLAEKFVKRLAKTGAYSFAIQLGDLIEDADEETDRGNFQKGVAILGRSSVPLYHVIGNHDTAHLPTSELSTILGTQSLYYRFQFPGCVCIVLHSLLPYPREGRSAISLEQLDWLQYELQAAHDPVIVYVHHSLADQDLAGNPWFDGHPQSCLIENRSEVRRILEDSGKVVAVVNGHLHWNRIDYHNGIPYITVQSAIENYADNGTPANAWGEISLVGGILKVDVFGNDRMSFCHAVS